MTKYAQAMSIKDILKFSKIGITAIGHVPGLSIRVYESGLKVYVFRYNFYGAYRIIKIGDIESISLKVAKSKALSYRAQILDLKDPYLILKHQKNLLSKNKKKDSTQVLGTKSVLFYKVFEEFVKFKRDNGGFRNNARGQQILKNTVINYAYPLIKDKDIKVIEPIDCFNILKEVWINKPAQADRLLQYLKQIFSYAQAMKYIVDTPINMNGALGILLHPLASQRKSIGHYPALDYKEIPEFCNSLWQVVKYGQGDAAKALLFSILTSARSKPVRNIKWSEIDFVKKIWTISLENDKSKQQDRNRDIFLSKYALALLRSMPRMDVHVFKTLKLRVLSDAALGSVIRDINESRVNKGLPIFVDPYITKEDGSHPVITQHGTSRATFKTWAKADELGNHLKFYHDAVELCLLHERKDPLRGAYDRSKFEKERRFVMEEWGKYCCSLFEDEILQLKPSL